jgi:hypothetical protein
VQVALICGLRVVEEVMVRRWWWRTRCEKIRYRVLGSYRLPRRYTELSEVTRYQF